MKRVVILTAVLAILVFPAAALKSSLEVGVNLSYNNADEGLVKDGSVSGTSLLDRIAVGLEMRANISNFQMAITGDISIIDTQSILFSGVFSAGISADMFKYLKVGFTTGPKVSYLYSSSDKSVSGSDVNNGENFLDALYKGHFHHRIMVDILAGPVMSIGAAYMVPTTFSLADGRLGNLLPKRDDLKKGQISVCISMKVF